MKIDREALYRRVWESPVTHIAKEFDVSDVGLAKACRKHEIPLPPPGYWTRVKHGKKVAKPPLPKRDPVEVEIDASRYRLKSRVPTPLDGPALNIELRPPGSESPLSNYTLATRRKLLSGKPNPSGSTDAVGPSLFECRTSFASVDTACELLDAVERALPQVGATLAKGEKSLEFELDGQRVEFRLVEQYTRSEVVEPGKVYQYWERPAIKFTFTGKFAFEITSYFEGRKRWADGKKQQLRDKLGEFLLCLVDAAKTLKQMKIDNEARQRRWAEEAQRRAEIERESKARADFRAKLLAEAAAARERDLLLDYIGRVKSELGVAAGSSLA